MHHVGLLVLLHAEASERSDRLFVYIPAPPSTSQYVRLVAGWACNESIDNDART